MILGVVCPLGNDTIKSESCLACSLTKKIYDCGNDTIVLAEMLEPRKVKGLSLSGITSDFLRRTLLYQLVDYYVTPRNGYYSVRGKWGHEAKRKVYLSPDFGETIREKRFTFPDTNISGQVDIYYARYEMLGDYKTTSRLPDGPRAGDIRQLNGYAELLHANDLEVVQGYITYLTYSRHVRMPVDIWERNKTQDMLAEMIDFYTECLDKHEVPPRDLCAGPDKWYACRWCPFRDVCKEHPDWWTVPEGLVVPEEEDV